MLILLTGFAMSLTWLALAGGIVGWFITLPATGIVLVLIFHRMDMTGLGPSD
jgi:uncharacterized protein YqgC (DUF456 family)